MKNFIEIGRKITNYGQKTNTQILERALNSAYNLAKYQYRTTFFKTKIIW